MIVSELTAQQRLAIAREYTRKALIHYRMALRILPRDAYQQAPWQHGHIKTMRALLYWIEDRTDLRARRGVGTRWRYIGPDGGIV